MQEKLPFLTFKEVSSFGMSKLNDMETIFSHLLFLGGISSGNPSASRDRYHPSRESVSSNVSVIN